MNFTKRRSYKDIVINKWTSMLFNCLNLLKDDLFTPGFIRNSCRSWILRRGGRYLKEKIWFLGIKIFKSDLWSIGIRKILKLYIMLLQVGSSKLFSLKFSPLQKYQFMPFLIKSRIFNPKNNTEFIFLLRCLNSPIKCLKSNSNTTLSLSTSNKNYLLLTKWTTSHLLFLSSSLNLW